MFGLAPTAPQIAVADGALGFWKALGEDAGKAFDAFVETYQVKYARAVRLPDQGPRCATGVLRLPGRATGHGEFDRSRQGQCPSTLPDLERVACGPRSHRRRADVQ